MRKPRSLNNDLTGQVFTRWTVLEKTEVPTAKGSMWLCRCQCGVEKIVSLSNLRGGLSKSCGCLHKEQLSVRRKTHGRSREDKYLYTIWMNIKARCYNSNNPRYKDYGGRGISMCREWLDSFEAFLTHVGERPTVEHTLDRTDNNGNYEPGNVRWATKSEQNRNKRGNVFYTHEGITKTVNEWATQYGISFGMLEYRLFTKGMSFEDAVSTPSQRPTTKEADTSE